jgi:spermidine synthase
MVRLLWKYPSKLTDSELNDTRLNVIHDDPRIVLRNAKRTYDAIYIGSAIPGDLASNRFFTEEFFALARSRLKPDGVFALCLPGSLSYISPELRDMNYLIINGLTRQFSRIRVIPGDYNIIVASEAAEFNLDPSAIYKRLRHRGVKVNLLNPGYLKQRLDGQWVDWFRRSTVGATREVNRDDRPLAVYQVLISWNKQFSRITMRILQELSRIRLWMIIAAIAALSLALLAALKLRPRRAPRAAILYSIATTGFFGMAMNLALMYSFQMQYGYIYQMIGALTAFFMAGVAAGSILMRACVARFKSGWAAFFAIETAILIFIFIGFACITRLHSGFIMAPLYLALCFITGALLGAEFPLAVRLYGGKGDRDSRAPGVVFCADLVGGVGAATAAGVILLPLLGIGSVALILAAFKAFAVINILVIKKVK